MLDLLDTSGFVPRKACGDWSPGLIWVHAGSDVLIWLAYTAIPLTLLFFVRRRPIPFPGLFWLAALFILACGTTHLIEAVIFEYPVYRLAGAVKLLTAGVSWATVVALIAAAPRILSAVDQAARAAGGGDPLAADRPTGGGRFPVAAAAGVLAVLGRWALDPVLKDQQAFILPLLAVVFAGWYGGLWPALLALAVAMVGVTYLFVEPRYTLVVARLPDQFGAGLFVFAGVACAMLGETQWVSWRRADRAVRELRAANAALAQANAILDTIHHHTPTLVYLKDREGRAVMYNPATLAVIGRPAAEVVGRTDDDYLPPATAAAIRAVDRRVMDAGRAEVVEERVGDGPDARVFLSVKAPHRGPAGDVIGLIGVSVEITAQKKLEDELRRNEAEYRALADSMANLAWVARPDGHIFWYNRRWYEYTGTTPAEMEGWGWQKVHDPAVLPDVMRRWPAAIAAGERFEMTFPLRAADGTYRQFLTRAEPVRDADGRVARWFGTNTDVTAQREMEAALRESAARFRALTETIPQLVWTCDPAGRCDYLSRQWVEYTGVPEADQLGFGWAGQVHPDDRAGTTAAWLAAVRAEAVYDSEFRIRGADGNYRWFRTRGVPLRGPDGAVTKWVGTNTDIDDQKREAERLEELVADRTAALREQQNFLDAILANVGDGIVACDAAGTLKLFNPAAREFHGLPAEPLPPDRWAECYDLYEPDGATPLPTDRIPLVRALRGERVRDAEMVIRPRGGPERFLVAVGQPLTDDAGRHLGAVVSMRDLTDRRRAEDRERAMTAELQRSNAELEKFAYVASHDLQEPLRKIQAFGDRLAKRYRDTLGEQWQEYVDRMLASAGRMRTLIDDLLSFSRVTTQARTFAPVDLNRTLRDAASDLEHRIGQTGARVDVGPLPTVVGDPVQLRQMFQNLIGNALKFHAPGRPPVVTVASQPAGSLSPADDPPPLPTGWRITVADNGIGFEQQYADRIFEVFQRLHGKEQYEGTGIGLAICRKVVERHGGTISARSQPGTGTRIIIDLPAPAGTEAAP